jgi:hypothetical protein
MVSLPPLVELLSRKNSNSQYALLWRSYYEGKDEIRNRNIDMQIF